MRSMSKIIGESPRLSNGRELLAGYSVDLLRNREDIPPFQFLYEILNSTYEGKVIPVNKRTRTSAPIIALLIALFRSITIARLTV